MAELAAAGSVVGLISLSIQSCQGLTSYYSAWKSYDEQISQTYRSVDELKILCESLGRELQRITQYQEPAVQQVNRLIASCQDGIKSLRDALDKCHSTQVPQNLATRIELHRVRALYPFKRQTLQSLKDTVDGIQRNLGTAVQILQIHLSTGHEQILASLARTASGIETTIQNNETAIRDLSSPLRAISQAFPLVQEYTEETAITVRAMQNEAHVSRQDAQNFREKVLQELTNLANHIEGSPISLERAIAIKLEHYSAEMNQLKHDLQFAYSQRTSEMAAKLEAIDQSIKGLQLGIISKPGLMQSVCEEKYRVENLPGPENARRDGWLRPRGGRVEGCQRCSCKLKPESSFFQMASNSKWRFTFEAESFSHHRTCPCFPRSARTTVAKLRMGSCWALLAGAIEASIAITRGAGGLSISPNLRCAHVVPYDSPAFRLIQSIERRTLSFDLILRHIWQLDTLLESSIYQLQHLFGAGKASPYDVDLDGNTLLHVVVKWSWRKFPPILPPGLVFESMVRFLTRLGELCVPLNWTNEYNLTFMNELVFNLPQRFDPCNLLTSVTPLLDIGAGFAKFSSKYIKLGDGSHFFHMARYAGSADVVDALEENAISIAILHQSERELIKALRDWPQLINRANGLSQTPLHLAVSWTYGIRELLKHDACVDSTDQRGYPSLFYAIYLGFSETVRLLMKADCVLVCDQGRQNVLSYASQCLHNGGYALWGVSQETRMDVFDTVIALLAERRRGLQSRLAALPSAVNGNTSVFRDDRILDEHTEYAECTEEDALRGYGFMPRASTLLGNCRTVYHIDNLNTEIAEKLWRSGFRDIDVQDNKGMTPLMLSHKTGYRVNFEIELCSWLIQKGAKLHRLQYSSLDYDPDRTPDLMELSPATRTLHYVAAKIGYYASYLAYITLPLEDPLDLLSIDAKLLLATILPDVLCDDCVCACSFHGCLASTMMLKVFVGFGRRQEVFWMRFTLAIKHLVILVGPQNPCWGWLAKEIIRFRTFEELELRHTCCEWSVRCGITKLEPEERVEIRDEDSEKIELLESLLDDFEENRGDQDLLSFLEGYWATKMDRVLEEQGGVNEEALREIGVVLYPEETEDDDSDDERSGKLKAE